MITIDTSVVSELVRPVPDARVVSWLIDQDEAIVITATALAEVSYGLELLPAGKRKMRLARAINRVISEFGDDVVSFDAEAARHYGRRLAAARRSGLTVSRGDAEIAACAAANSLTVATRDTAPFEAMGVACVNPWED